MKLKKLLRKVFGPKRPKPTLKRPHVPSDRSSDSTLTVNNLTPGVIDAVGKMYGYGPITSEFVLLMAERRMSEEEAKEWWKLIRLERVLPDFPVPPMSDFDRAVLTNCAHVARRDLAAKYDSEEQVAGMTLQIVSESMSASKCGYRGRAGVLCCANCDHQAAPAKSLFDLGFCDQEGCLTGRIKVVIPRPTVAWQRIATGARHVRLQLTGAERVTAMDMDAAQVEEIRDRVAERAPLTEEEIQEIKRCVEDWRAHYCHGKSAASFVRTSRGANITPAPFDADVLPPDMSEPSESAEPLFDLSKYLPPASPTNEHQEDSARRATSGVRLRDMAAGGLLGKPWPASPKGDES